jgi:hypothetical protein
MTTPHINTLRDHLLQTLADLRNREQPMEPDRARAVAQVASVLVDTAKVEVEYLKVTGQSRAGFLEEPADQSVAHLGNTPASPFPQPSTTRLPGMTRHRLQG